MERRPLLGREQTPGDVRGMQRPGDGVRDVFAASRAAAVTVRAASGCLRPCLVPRLVYSVRSF